MKRRISGPRMSCHNKFLLQFGDARILPDSNSDREEVGIDGLDPV